jgi:hypothetical protein
MAQLDRKESLKINLKINKLFQIKFISIIETMLKVVCLTLFIAAVSAGIPYKDCGINDIIIK